MKESKIRWYLEIAKVVAKKSPCTRRKCGVVLVKNDGILSTGYNGTIRGAINCGKDIPCLKDLYGEGSYFKSKGKITSYQYCPVVHGEVNAILNAARSGVSTIGSTMFFLTTDGYGMTPCLNCRRVMVNAGIKDYYTIGDDGKLIHQLVSGYITLDNEWMEKLLENSNKNEKT